MSAPTAVELRLTGVPALLLPGRPEHAHALDRQAALIAALLALQGPMSRPQLAQQLWPEASTTRARANLRQCLFRLRTAAGPPWLHADDELRLAGHVGLLPVGDPEAGELLEGLAAPESPALADWLQAARSAARAAKLHALAERIREAEAAQRLAEALRHAGRMRSIDPLNEAHYRELMRLHYLSGQHREALSCLNALREMLAREFDALPDHDTLALAQLIRREAAEPALRAATEPVAAAWTRPPELAGRQAELALLVVQLRQRATLLVVGEGGMGKSRLLQAAVQQLNGAASLGKSLMPAALSVAAMPGDAEVPYAFATRWLRALLATSPGRADDNSTRSALALLLPECGEAPSATAARNPAARLRAAAQRLLQTATGHGLAVLVIDDLHHADAASVELLQGLPESPAGPGCGWLIALRPDEGVAAVQNWARALQQASAVHTLRLAPLDVAGVSHLLQSLGPGESGYDDEARAQALHRHTGGNPLFVLETLKARHAMPAGAAPAAGADARAWPTAPTVLRLIQQRLARLSPAALELARCAALLGQEMTPALLARWLGQRPSQLVDAWAELEAAQVLRGDGFAHDLIAEAALGSVPAAIAQTLHAQAAALLEASGSAPARLAEHWLAAQQPLRAAPHQQAAARHAARLGRLQEAVGLMGRAAATLQAHGQRREAFDAWLVAADLHSLLDDTASVAACEPALRALADDEGQQAAAACATIYCLVQAHRIAEARAVALTALAQAERAGVAEIEVELLWVLVVLAWRDRDAAPAIAWAERALLRLDDVDPQTARLNPATRRMQLLDALGNITTVTGPLAEGRHWLEQAHAFAVQVGNRLQATNAACSLATAALIRGDATDTARWLDRAAAESGSGGSSSDSDSDPDSAQARAWALVAGLQVLAPLGRLGPALALAERAPALFASHPSTSRVPAALFGAQLRQQLGRTDLALKTLRDIATLDDLAAVDRARLNALLLAAGAAADTQAVLAWCAGSDDLHLRAELLCLTPLPADVALPLLSAAADEAEQRGAHGLWLMLQARRLGVQRALGGIDAPARALATRLWAGQQQGLIAPALFPAIAAELCATLAPFEPELAQTIALRAGAWMLNAAATLPLAWRQNYLTRAPLLQVLPARERGLLFGLAG